MREKTAILARIGGPHQAVADDATRARANPSFGEPAGPRKRAEFYGMTVANLINADTLAFQTGISLEKWQ